MIARKAFRSRGGLAAWFLMGTVAALSACLDLGVRAENLDSPRFVVPDGFVVEKVAGPPLVRYPLFACFDDRGRLYVADQFNHRIQVFTADGQFLGSWGKAGDAAGQFDRPSDVAFDDFGRVYIADFGNARVQVFKVVQKKTTGP